jgi:hypothetical protein
MILLWNRNNQHDNQDQHHVDQGRHVDVHHWFWISALTTTRPYIHTHGIVPSHKKVQLAGICSGFNFSL